MRHIISFLSIVMVLAAATLHSLPLAAAPADNRPGEELVVAAAGVARDTAVIITDTAANALESIMVSPAGEVLREVIGEIAEEAVDEAVDRADAGSSTDEAVLLVAVIGVFVFPCILAGVVVVLTINYLNRRDVRRQQLIELSLRSGVALPREFYQRRRPRRLLHSLYWLAWGLGLMIFFGAAGADPVAALMVVPCMIGCAQLITYIIEKRGSRDGSDFQD